MKVTSTSKRIDLVQQHEVESYYYNFDGKLSKRRPDQKIQQTKTAEFVA